MLACTCMCMLPSVHTPMHACKNIYARVYARKHLTFTSCKSLKSKLTISMKNKTNKYIHVTLLQVREVNEESFRYYIA